MYPTTGEIVDVIKHEGQTKVFVQSGMETTTYCLDEGLIEFGTGIFFHYNYIVM